jgi:hypothetical protein
MPLRHRLGPRSRRAAQRRGADVRELGDVVHETGARERFGTDVGEAESGDRWISDSEHQPSPILFVAGLLQAFHHFVQ